MDNDLFVLGRGAGLNFSEILNTAIAALLGVPYEEKDLLRKKRYHLEEKIRGRYAAESRAIAAEKATKEAEKMREQEEEQKQERLWAAITRAITGLEAVAFGRLPEFDRHGDYYDFWERIAAAASVLAGCEVSVSAVQEVVRRGRTRG